MTIKYLKDCLQSAHINFLFGSGLSRPYLSTLGDIEKLISLASSHDNNDEIELIISSLYASYFNKVMRPCLPSESNGNDVYNNVLENYKDFLSTWNKILAKRKTNLLEKTVNIFSTNIDTFIESAAELTGIEFNDGFHGHINPTFREDSFSNVVSKISPLYQNTAQIPVFNYLKIHGSINWRQAADSININLDQGLSIVQEIADAYDSIPKHAFIEISGEDDIESLIKKAKDLIKKDSDTLSHRNSFEESYKKLIMVNPRKEKFRESVLDLHFYELMRLYSNALESTSSVLFCAGFSFADEHISKITLRSANANPTLSVVIFAFNADAKREILTNLQRCGSIINNNIRILEPDSFWKQQDDDYKSRLGNKAPIQFDFTTINKYVFHQIFNQI